jgi:hypothetical protein
LLALGGCLEEGQGACRGGNAVALAEDFERYAEGAPLASGWELGLEGPDSFVRVSRGSEGQGAGDSTRFLIVLNDGAPDTLTLSAATPPVDLSGCRSARLEAQLIIFSLETTEDAAFFEIAGNGMDYTQLVQLFPSPYFASDVNCRPGGQDRGCVAWMPFAFDVPTAMLGPGVRARLRLSTFTEHCDAAGLDNLRLIGQP